MGYSKKEFWHDVNDTNQKYERGTISYEQRMRNLDYYLSVYEKIDEEDAKSIRRTMGL